MSRSTSFVSLHDPETCWKDPDAKSIAYFAKRPNVRLSRTVIGEIKEMAQQTGKNVRLSLHRSPNADLHEMIICQLAGQYNRPKRHLTKAQSFHIIEGEMVVFVFDNDGAVIDTGVLDGKSSLIYRIGRDIYYTGIALTPYAIYYETTPGPFLGRAEERIFAPFSPDETDQPAYLAYRDRLLELIGR
jgi:cupin fold WbuC family metalloprotein